MKNPLLAIMVMSEPQGAKTKPMAGRGGLPVSDNFLEIAPIAVCAAGSGV